jgi:ABC-type glycerol-3-phosphate transport system permease component
VSRALRRRAGGVGFYGFLGVVVLVSLGPTLWVMSSSFKTGTQISGGGLVPDPWSLQGYKDAFAEVGLHRYLLNTLLYAVGGTLGSVSAALLAAYPTARYRFLGRNVLVASFSLALAIPVVGLATPEFFIARELGLYDSRLGMVVFYSGLLFPLSFVILRAFLVNLPSEVEEAALVDGAGYFTIIRRVVIPLARPALATVAVIAFVAIWNEFFFANLLTASEEVQTAQVALAGFKSQFWFNIAGAVAGATVVMIVPILAFLLLQRQVIEGLTAGSTK